MMMPRITFVQHQIEPRGHPAEIIALESGYRLRDELGKWIKFALANQSHFFASAYDTGAKGISEYTEEGDHEVINRRLLPLIRKRCLIQLGKNPRSGSEIQAEFIIYLYVKETHSVSAGLDYPGVGPEYSWLKDIGRAEYVASTDEKALRGFRLCTQLEGIIPALESSHTLWEGIRRAKTLSKEINLVITLERELTTDKMQTPVFGTNTAPERQSGRKPQISNITAAKISRKIAFPCGDGTTSVIILAGEILAQSLAQLEHDIHPVVIISAHNKALKESLDIIKKISVPINTSSDDEMLSLIKTLIGTKFVARWRSHAVRTVAAEENGHKTVDIKRYVRVEKIPGGSIEESRVLDGILLNKDTTRPNMRRRIQQPRILLLGCLLEYKKGKARRTWSFSRNRIRRVRKKSKKSKSSHSASEYSNSNLTSSSLKRAFQIRPRAQDVGSLALKKIGDYYFMFLTTCGDPKACTILLRAPSRDILNEIDRNLADALSLARNAYFNPTLAPGGGATEI
ncbi:TCP-1/cpn60 chaperonin family domain containing protein [Tylopilus felleus]